VDPTVIQNGGRWKGGGNTSGTTTFAYGSSIYPVVRQPAMLAAH
jgi:hypothetical protein